MIYSTEPKSIEVTQCIHIVGKPLIERSVAPSAGPRRGRQPRHVALVVDFRAVSPGPRPSTDGKNIWRLYKTYGPRIGYPRLKPHDLRHGEAMEVYEEHNDLEQATGARAHGRLQDLADLKGAQRRAAL